MIGNQLVLFGGFSEPAYFGDLHTIDVDTGEVVLLDTSGESPAPRSTPVVIAYSNKLYIWGGFNGELPTELNVLDFPSKVWRRYDHNVSGRTALSYVLHEHTIYSYGSSKNGGMLMIDLEANEITTRQTTGAEPPSAVMASGMVQIGKYAFFFGGRANTHWTLMYACDLSKLWWFVFHVKADGESVSVTDGCVSESGLFMLPRIHSFSMCYVAKTRKIIAFLGNPETDPPPLFIVAVGDAMAVIHLRDDLLSALKNDFTTGFP
jgi:hypothetical protein